MEQDELYKALVMYHAKVNLKPRLPRLPKPFSTPIFPPEGSENKRSVGAYIAANGPTLADKLMRDEIIENLFGDPMGVACGEDLEAALELHKNEDGGFIHDGQSRHMWHVPRFNTTRDKMSRFAHLAEFFWPGIATRKTLDFRQFVPADFLSYDGRRPVYRHNECMLGTKTMSAIELAQRYHVQVMLIKQTAFGPSEPVGGIQGIGLGQVVRFGTDGRLKDTFFFARDQYDRGRPFDEEHDVVALYRQYETRDGKPALVSQRYVTSEDFAPKTIATQKDRAPGQSAKLTPAYA